MYLGIQRMCLRDSIIDRFGPFFLSISSLVSAYLEKFKRNLTAPLATSVQIYTKPQPPISLAHSQAG